MVFELFNSFNRNISISEIGAKAYNLLILHKNNINVAPGIVIHGDITNDDFIYLQNKLTKQTKYAVRSSMSDEDMDNCSNAGKYKTLLSVDREDLKSAILTVMESGKNVMNKAVLIQPMILSEVSGVMFTRNPVSNANEILIEAVLGIGENCVSGDFNPDRFYYNPLNNNIFSKHINEKYITYFFCNNASIAEKHVLNGIETRVMISNENEALSSVCFLDRNKAALVDSQIIQLAKLANRIQKIFGKPQDIEFTIANNTINILQSRPITAISNKMRQVVDKEVSKDKKKLRGTIVSGGYFKGKVLKIDNDCFYNDDDLSNRILVMNELTPEIIYSIEKFGAVVTEIGGVLCHAAIVCREKQVPCIVNVDDIFQKVENDDEIIVDANKGVVYI